jgi:serine/threonine-protein kinase
MAPTTSSSDLRYAEQPRRTGWFFAILVLLLIGLGVLLFFFARSLGVDSSEKVKIPDVVNQPEPTARATLQQAGFIVAANSEHKNDPKIAKGNVISTNPAIGSKAKKGSTVTLVVSDGPQGLPMPDVSSNCPKVDDAIRALTDDAKIDPAQITQVPQPSDTCDQGTVISQSPAKGTELASGATVTLTVSSGPKSQVPDVAGNDVTTATQALQASGYSVSSVIPRYSSSVPNGRVIGTDPPAGTPLMPNSAVKLIVSQGPAPTTTSSSTTTTSSTTSSTTPHGSSTSSSTLLPP